MGEGLAAKGLIEEHLSALVDGEARADELSAALGAWAQDSGVRAKWHSYQLIGDVLRSEDLATRAAHDAAFFAGLRQRLAGEPVVIAPEPAAPARRAGSARWVATAAVAASVVAVSGWMLRPSPAGNSAQVAAAASAAVPVRAVAAGNLLAPALTPGVGGLQATDGMLRDPLLDGYFAAHKQYAGGSAVGMPSGFLRNATVEVPAR